MANQDNTGFSQSELDELNRLLDAEGIAGDADAIPVRKTGATAPASFSQELIWLLDRATPGLTAYNIPNVRRLRGVPDIAALEAALSLVSARHESLRTVFGDVDGHLQQVIDAPSHVVLRRVDVGGVPAGDREGAAEREVRSIIRTAFDLTQDHLFRATLVRLADDDHVLVLESHHIVVDGWSLGIIFRELAAAYAAAVEKRPHGLHVPRIQFGDFAAWQRDRLSGDRLESLLGFWRTQLGSATEPLGLPTDFARPKVPTFSGARQTIVIPRDRVAAIKKMAAQGEATLYMALLASYATVLHRYTGRNDVLIGSGSAGRTIADTENMVGYLANTLVQRADFTGNPTFAELLNRVRMSALKAYDNQEVPLEKLVLELRQGDERLNPAPLFDVVLTMQDTTGATISFAGLTVESFGVDFGATKFDITLLVSERDDELGITAQYRSDLFAPETMKRFVGHVAQVLEAAAANSSVRISAIPLLTPSESAQVSQWNSTTADEGKPATLTELFEAQAARVPTRSVVVGGGSVLTYQNLNEGANQIAHFLRASGVAADTPVGLLFDRTADALAGIVAILKSGGAYVPLSTDAPSARLAQQISDAGIKIVVTNAAYVSRVPASVQTLVVDGADDITKLAAHPTANPSPVAGPQNIAYVLYTSGSTGTPKGVAVTHANAVHYARAVSRVLADTKGAGDGSQQLDGFSFGMVSTLAADLGNTSLLVSLICGGTLHLLGTDVTTDPARFAEYAGKYQVDVLKITPNHLAALTGGKTGADLAAVLPKKWIVTGGEALRLDFARALLGANTCRVLNHYGPTETTVGVCTNEVTLQSLDAFAAMGAQTVPLGRPLANTHAFVVDTYGNEQPVNIPGELLIGGAGVTQGYLRRPDLTAERFVQHQGERVYRTGDRARRLADGTIEFLGRADDQVKIRGFRVELGEIEQALRGHPGVAQAAAVIRADEGKEPQLVVYVQVKTEGYAVSHSDRPTSERLTEWLAAQLPDYMVPSAVVLLDEMPLTSNGKIDRAKLRALDVATAMVAEFIEPRTPTETSLATIWAEVLKREKVGVTDNFMALGGHSLLAIRILGKITRTMGVRLPLRSLFDSPTVEALAKIVDAEPKAAAAPTISARSRDSFKIE